ncbi:MAG: secondary thiamine-phosphate synthase enzyme YjbQ [Actinomycetota bacterium]
MFDTAGERIVEITDAVRRFAADAGKSGLVNVFLPHATAGLALMETGSGSEEDLMRVLDDWMPPNDDYLHRHGATGHGRDHILPAFIPPSLSIPVEDGQLVLGTWQSVVIVDTNASNNQRRVRLSFVPG